MTDISFPEIFKALENTEFPDCELVVGIAEGGIIPAGLIARKIGCDLKVVRFNYRNEENIPRYPEPVLLSKVPLPSTPRRILLVDDVSVSGKTLNAARKLLKNHQVATMVFKGKADYVLFPKITDCVSWPWKDFSDEEQSIFYRGKTV